MPNSRRKKSGGSSARRDSSTQKESAVAATVAVAPTVSDPPAIDGRVAINGIAKEDTQPLVNGCSTHISNIQNGNLAASSQTESSDIESLSSDSSRRNTMSSSGGDRTAKGARCKTKEDEQRPVGDTPQSYSITSQVDYASDEGAVRTPEDTYPCCSSSEAVGGGVSEGYTSVSGAASQTESSSGTGDGLLSVLSMSSWDRVDTICELVSFLNIYELRLLGACVEGAARPASSTPTMRQHETRSNCPQFIGTMATEMSQVPYALKVEAAYNVVCLLSSANRQGAHALIRLIDHLMTIRDLELEVLSTDEARREVLINLGKLVSASIHHPAFSVDQRIRMVHARDEIRSKLEQLTTRMNPPVASSVSNDSKSIPASCRTSPLSGGFAFVRRFHATQPDADDPDNFLVEMIWSDGERTFVGRTRNDINTLHHRLLDMFGEERRELKQAQDADTEQPESACSSRTPSPTATDSNATPTPAVGSSALRILPYFSMDCSPAAVIQYINALSDLPARMMLSSVIYEQFFASRLSSEEVEVAERPMRVDSPRPQRFRHPASAPATFPVASAALAYSSRGMGIQEPSTDMKDENLAQEKIPQTQVQFPSCSNCAGAHAFVQCPKDTPLQKDGTFRLDFGGGVHDSTCPNCSAVAMAAAAIGPRPTGVEHFPNLPPGLMPPPAMMPLVPGMPMLARHFSPYVFRQTPPPTSQPHPHL
ncbi:hypothetical protein Aduo_001379 [Ancylostoma duodenale]